MTIPASNARARALRLAAGDSMIDLAVKKLHFKISPGDILHMEQGHPACGHIAKIVIGHYRGTANAQPITCPVGQRLREIRMAAGDTQEALAIKLGIPPEYVSKVERNPLRWSRKTARRMAAVYGVSIDAEIQAELALLNEAAAAFEAAEAA